MKYIKNRISIIVPAHNEEDYINKFIKDVVTRAYKLKLNYELIIVENGSKDGTYKKANELAAKNKNIKLIKLKKAGYGQALIAGLKKATSEYGIVFNVDFWDERFFMLPKADLLGYDVVTGSKLLPGSKDRRSFSRKVVTRCFNLFLRRFLGFKGTDTHGIKAFRLSSIIPIVKKCKTNTGIFDSELMIRVQRENLKILELPVEVKEIRSARFSFKRQLQTPHDIFMLYKVLH